jgi:hypothetical protein
MPFTLLVREAILYETNVVILIVLAILPFGAVDANSAIGDGGE